MMGIKAKLKFRTLIGDDGPASIEVLVPPGFPAQILQRYAELFDRYEVNRWDWQSLAIALAVKYEPELQLDFEESLARRRTKKTKWNSPRLLLWWWQVETAKAKTPKFSIAQACNTVAKRREWQEVKPTRQRYYDALRDPLVMTCIKVMEQLGRRNFSELMDSSNWSAVATDLDAVNEDSLVPKGRSK